MARVRPKFRIISMFLVMLLLVMCVLTPMQEAKAEIITLTAIGFSIFLYLATAAGIVFVSTWDAKQAYEQFSRTLTEKYEMIQKLAIIVEAGVLELGAIVAGGVATVGEYLVELYDSIVDFFSPTEIAVETIFAEPEQILTGSPYLTLVSVDGATGNALYRVNGKFTPNRLNHPNVVEQSSASALSFTLNLYSYSSYNFMVQYNFDASSIVAPVDGMYSPVYHVTAYEVTLSSNRARSTTITMRNDAASVGKTLSGVGLDEVYQFPANERILLGAGASVNPLGIGILKFTSISDIYAQISNVTVYLECVPAVPVRVKSISIGHTRTYSDTGLAARVIEVFGDAGVIDLGGAIAAFPGTATAPPIAVPVPITQAQILTQLGIMEFVDTAQPPYGGGGGGEGDDKNLKAPDAYKLPAGIAGKFPFCVPFDLIALVAILNETGEAPKWVIPLPFGFAGYDGSFTIDFAMFEPVAAVIRTFMTLLFILGLVLITRKIIQG